MRRPFPPPTLRAGSFAAVIAAAPFFVAHAQSASESTAGASNGAPAKKPEPKVLRLEDFAQWNRITSTALSPDGKWMTFTYSPNEGGQNVLHVKALDGSKDYTVSMANGGGRAGGGGGGRGGAGGGGAPSFTDDSKWAAYMVTPGGRQGAGGGNAGRGGRGRGGGAPARAEGEDQQSNVAHLELLNLETGDKVAIPSASQWKFSGDAR